MRRNLDSYIISVALCFLVKPCRHLTFTVSQEKKRVCNQFKDKQVIREKTKGGRVNRFVTGRIDTSELLLHLSCLIIVGFRMTLSIGTRSIGQMILRLCAGVIPPVLRVAIFAANFPITIKQVKKSMEY